jgi:hypothetical protein
VSTLTGQRAGPNELCGHIAELRGGSLKHVGEDGERLVFCDLVPLHQDALCLFDKRARHHCGAQVSEILAAAGCCFRIADEDGGSLSKDRVSWPRPS